MKKRVNVYPNGRVITTLSVPIRNTLTGAELDLEEIRKLLVGGASVKEILPNGALVPLTMNNYADTDLFEKYQQEVAAEEAARNQKRIEEEKLKQDIANKNESRRDAVAAFKRGAFGEVKPQPTATVEQSAIEAARAKIEANKHK